MADELIIFNQNGDATELQALEKTLIDENTLTLAEKVEKMEIVIELIPEYREFLTPGEKSRGVYLGTTTITKKGPDGEILPLTAVQWLEKTKLWLNAGTTLVRAVADLPENTPIEIEYLGQKGRAKIYQVRILG
ncbi:MAG: hypothetical protein D6750_10150 [Bacteroidetes bacterium]|jgi:hypothetical protein|nr:MAG: hypothetical protein D6750_10150 [Bacteroidota bacterium]